ncbi:MAG: hypothetical protein L6422_09110 [Candidatus Marinimicrobia bacterium]|nr:hypothetical protein [Candidatus Neomarinimicrobiota bacterium]
MNFVPPQFSLATAEYVDKTISKTADKTADEVMAKAEAIIEEKISGQKKQVETIIQDIEKQRENSEKVLASMENITKKSQTIDYQFRKMMEDIQNSKRETRDDLDEMSVTLNTNLEKMSDTLTVNLTKLSKLINDNVQTLKAQDQQFTDIINHLQIQLENTPEKTLEGLRKAIEDFLKEN